VDKTGYQQNALGSLIVSHSSITEINSGKIVGQVTLAPLDHWWQDISNAYEIAVEVSSGWRKLGIAHQLLSFMNCL
jgi:hypothetical protein